MILDEWLGVFEYFFYIYIMALIISSIRIRAVFR